MSEVKTQELLILSIPTFDKSSGHPVTRVNRDKVDIKKWLKKDTNRLQIESLLEKARQESCYGLAANQCRSEGIPDQIAFSGWLDVDAFILKMPNETPIAIIAPEITEVSSIMVRTQEGCLTYPGRYIKATRQTRVGLSYYTLNGEPCVKIFEGLSAQIIQHEIDHLLGHDDEDFEFPISASERGPFVKTGRNDPCPCTTGKKYKNCCLPLIKSMIV